MPAGGTARFVLEPRNLTGSPVRLVGVSTECGCVVADELPRPLGDDDRLTLTVDTLDRFYLKEERVTEYLAQIHTDPAGPPRVVPLRLRLFPRDLPAEPAGDRISSPPVPGESDV